MDRSPQLIIRNKLLFLIVFCEEKDSCFTYSFKNVCSTENNIYTNHKYHSLRDFQDFNSEFVEYSLNNNKIKTEKQNETTHCAPNTFPALCQR